MITMDRDVYIPHKYSMVIVGEIHNTNMIEYYDELLYKIKPEYFICEFAYEDIVLTQEELADRLAHTTDGKFLKNIPDYQDNYEFYRLAYKHHCKLIGCNPYHVKRFKTMNEEDKVRESFMLQRIQEYDKYNCVIQLGDHHLRSIPITKDFLEFCNDIEDDRGIVTDLTVDFPSPIFEYYKDKSFAMIIRVKEEYINEQKFLDSKNESKDYSTLDKNHHTKTGLNFNVYDIHSKQAEIYINQSKRYDDKLKPGLDYWKHTKVGEIAVADNRVIGYILVTKAGEITPLYIYENYRGYGVSNTLLEDAINKYGGRSLGMYADNEIAIHLYQKYGFKIVKTKTYSDGTKVYIMVLEQ